MKINSISLDHERARNFVMERTTGAGVWIFIAMKAKAVFNIDGREIPSPENSFILRVESVSYTHLTLSTIYSV